jgi:3-oxoacyl-[acyl-carrier protein] reductase
MRWRPSALAKYLGETHPVTCLVNNVGIVRPAWFDEATIEDFDALMHLNVRAALICAQAVVPSMRRLGAGRIVMNASRVILGKEARTVYSATKVALQSMARTWALELAKSRITVNCVVPGPIATTAFWQNNDSDSPQTKHIIDGVPGGAGHHIGPAVPFNPGDAPQPAP